MNYDKLNFYDAITKLAQMYGIEIEIDEKAKQKQNIKSQLLEIHKIATQHYQELLKIESNKEFLDYLKNRNISNDMIKTFNIGCSNKNNSRLLEILRI